MLHGLQLWAWTTSFPQGRFVHSVVSANELDDLGRESSEPQTLYAPSQVGAR